MQEQLQSLEEKSDVTCRPALPEGPLALSVGSKFHDTEINYIYAQNEHYLIFRCKGDKKGCMRFILGPKTSLPAQHEAKFNELIAMATTWGNMKGYTHDMVNAVTHAINHPEAPLSIWEPVERKIRGGALSLARLLYVIGALAFGAPALYAASITAVGDAQSACAAGALGALASVFLRVNSMTHDINLSPLVVVVAGGSRVFLGVIFGWFAYVSIKAGIVLSFANAPHLIVVVAFIAGFLERYIPDAIGKFTKTEDQGSSTET